ncbi:MAG: hypothetical protein GWN58_33220 [Anaerolineae bacterium]|nr:hypothetical protein [Thermoplasmata archaeon]NIV34137.1 hypothetical protein [Anaerolineae bacterium]NIY05988.1 hypothetical protein [Thermoplasmata archaeon]
MTTYFDEAVRDVTTQAGLPDDEFLENLRSVEARVCTDVSLCVGDREFPDSMREKILGIIAVWQVREDGGVPTKGRLFALVSRTSFMLGELHGAFHRLAAGRVKTRFGMLTDDPEANLKMRACHDG